MVEEKRAMFPGRGGGGGGAKLKMGQRERRSLVVIADGGTVNRRRLPGPGKGDDMGRRRYISCREKSTNIRLFPALFLGLLLDKH